MSREQWGHGFYRGIEAAIKSAPNYCVTYDDHGHIERICIVQEVHDSVYVLEAIDYIWFVVNGLAKPSRLPINYENVYEVQFEELSNPKFYYTWESVQKAFMNDERLYKKEGA